ncbi:MAG: CPBP family glutamic-type intramembrane protease [Promethearchaeota archaeon]
MNNNSPENNKKSLITPLSWFLFFTFLIGAIGYLPWVLSSYGFIPFITLYVYIGGVSPLLGALISSRIVYGKDGPEYNFGQFNLNAKKAFPWVLLAFVLPLIQFFGQVFLYFLFVGPYNLFLILWIEFIPAVIVNFIFSIGKEFGWSSFALPHLQERFSPFYSSLILSIITAAWHWPHFLLKDSPMLQLYGFIWNFLLFVILVSIVQTWIYNKGKGCLLTVLLLHGTANATLVFNFPVNIYYVLLIKTIILITILLIFRKEIFGNDAKVTFSEIMEFFRTKAEESEKLK